MKLALLCLLGLCVTADVLAQEAVPAECGPGARGRGARIGGAAAEAPAGAARAGGDLFARFASRPANLVPGPTLGYTPALAGLQWPSGAGNEQTSTASVAVDSRGHIFVYHRPEVGKPPLLEFDATGKFVKAFGSELQIVRAHGMRIDAGDNIWITDVTSHTVSKLDRNGKLLMTLGTKGRRANGTRPVARSSSISRPMSASTARAMSMWPTATADPIPALTSSIAPASTCPRCAFNPKRAIAQTSTRLRWTRAARCTRRAASSASFGCTTPMARCFERSKCLRLCPDCTLIHLGSSG